MRVALPVLIFLLVSACGKGVGTPRQQGSQPGDGTAGTVRLTLTSEEVEGEYRVNLQAPGASDLYQVAGTLTFDPLKYEVVAIEAGGGLGQPDSSYFAGQETAPGRAVFAYTRRFWGEGADGDLWLVSLRVRPRGAFRLADFAVDRESRLLARDSKKRELEVETGGAK
jgi:hypothetical protein